jgi:hypothetical protein
MRCPANTDLLTTLHDDGGRCASGSVFGRRVAASAIGQGQHGVGQVGWFFEFESEFGFGQQRRNFFHAIQRFDAALRLLGFAGLGFESVDEPFAGVQFCLVAWRTALVAVPFARHACLQTCL